MKLEELLACPICKTQVKIKNAKGVCPTCNFSLTNKNGIWHCLYVPNKASEISHKQYEKIYKENVSRINDGSYEILASIARGNKTVDIACGVGFIEKLSPETVGVDFSLNALRKAKANGAKHLVLADAHALPFKNSAFDIAISSGNLEHFADPQKAINEMARVSRIQVIIVHKYPPLPLAPLLYKLFTLFLKIKHQPIEKPIEEKELLSMMKNAGVSIVYKGVWTLPVNYGRVIKFLPELNNIPSCSFIISIKK